MCAHLLAKMDSNEEGYGWLTSLTMGWRPLPFDLQGAFLCMCSRGWGVSLTSRMRHMWSFISYLGRAQPPASSCFYGVSAIMEFLSTGEKLFSLGPIYLLPQEE